MAADLNQTCDEHPERVDCPDALIAEVRGGFGIIIHDGGASVIEITHCPWCGAGARQSVTSSSSDRSNVRNESKADISVASERTSAFGNQREVWE